MSGQQLGPLAPGHGLTVRLQEVRHRRLAVDDDVPPSWEVDDGIGPNRRAVRADGGDLLVEVAAGQ